MLHSAATGISLWKVGREGWLMMGEEVAAERFWGGRILEKDRRRAGRLESRMGRARLLEGLIDAQMMRAKHRVQ